MKDKVILESHNDGIGDYLIVYINGTLVQHVDSLNTYAHGNCRDGRVDVTIKIEDANVIMKSFYKGKEQ